MRFLLSLLFPFLLVATACAQTPGQTVLKTATGSLYGTLQLPAVKKKMPVVLIVPGSGPVDRDGNDMFQVSSPIKALADSLRGRGMATLRYDKRGIGESRAAMPSEANLRFDAYITDVADWIRLLRKDARFSRVIVLGYDEGALIGMLALAGQQVDGFISIAGSALPADEQIMHQLREDKRLSPSLIDSCRMMLDLLKAGQPIDSVPRHLKSIFRPTIQAYLVSWIKYDPRLELPKVKIPTLLIQGTTDLQVPVAQAALLARAKPDARFVQIEGMNHALRKAPADPAQNMATYSQPGLPIETKLVAAIAAFVRSLR